MKHVGLADRGIRASLLLSVFGFILGCFSYTVTAAVYETTPSEILNHDRLVRTAMVTWQQGQPRKALPLLVEAEKLAQSLDSTRLIESRIALGRLFYELGEYPVSIKLLESIASIDGDDAETNAEALNTLATIHGTLNNPGDALAGFNEAYESASRTDNESLKFVIAVNFLRHQLDYGLNSEVNAWLTTTWKHFSEAKEGTAERLDLAEPMISLANLYRRAVMESNAAPEWRSRGRILLRQANDIGEAFSNPRINSYAKGYLGQFYLDEGNYEQALELARQATFLAHADRAYEVAYLWQWQIAQVYRAQGKTSESIRLYKEAIVTLEHVRQALIKGSPFSFPQKIQPLYSELSDLLLTTASNAKGRAKQRYLMEVQEILEQAKVAELQDYFQNECVIPDKAVDLQNIETATAVIYPVILPDRLEVLVNIDNSVHQYVSQISRADLQLLVNDFRDQLQEDAGDEEYLEIGEELYQLLFAEVDDLLKQSGVDTLLVIPDGVLRTIPMSAIYDGNAFMIEKYAIATTPGVGLTLPKPLEVQESRFFAGGVSDAVQGFVGLPGVSLELDNLAEQYGARVLRNTDFDRAVISEQLASTDYSIVHIATHGHFDRNPQKSFLLTYDNKLTMDVLEQSIGGRGEGNELELLVLSACETAAGDSRAALGLAGVALKAGARSAVATLWEISDTATAKIINTFYANTSSGAVTKAKALQIAQVQLIRESDYIHPTDWAPFLLIGNWL